MSTERSSLLIEPQARLDSASFERLASIMPSGISEQLNPSVATRAEEWQRFDEDSSYLPDFRVRSADVNRLDQEETALRSFKRQLQVGAESDPLTAQQYRWRVNELIGQIDMIKASKTGNMSAFAQYNHFVYGEPSKAVFSDVVDHYMKIAESAVQSDDPAIRAAATNVQKRFGEMPRGDAANLQPSDETFQKVRALHLRQAGYLALALEGVEMPDGNITRETGDPILRKVLGNLGAGHYALADASGLTWSANNNLDENLASMKRPAKYDLSAVKFMSLPVGHEGRHILEFQNGLRGPIGLAALGFDRYERGNEASGVIGEQIAYPNFGAFAKTPRWDMLLRRQLMTSLASGHAGRPMNLREVHDAVLSVNYLGRLLAKAKAPAEEALKRTRTMIDSEVYKGTDGSAGTAFGRYSQYLDGTVDLWRALAVNPALYEQGERGKYDLVNSRHTQFARQKGILPVLT